MLRRFQAIIRSSVRAAAVDRGSTAICAGLSVLFQPRLRARDVVGGKAGAQGVDILSVIGEPDAVYLEHRQRRDYGGQFILLFKKLCKAYFLGLTLNS